MSVNVILLEKVESLGGIGDVVSVKPGYARNYLLPQNKALHATKDNIAYFEKEKAAIEKVNAEKRKEAEKTAKSLEGLTVNIIRQASEGGQLYGSINARDISEAIATAGTKVRRGQVNLNQSFKSIGLFDVDIVLHPEVTVSIKLNVARSEDEAKIQLKSGKALIAAEDETVEDVAKQAEVQMTDKQQERAETMAEDLLEDSALKAKQAAEEAEAQAKIEAEKAEAEAAEKKAAEEAAKAEKAETTEETDADKTAEDESETAKTTTEDKEEDKK